MCDVTGLIDAGLDEVDLVARLRLVAVRGGCRFVVRGADERLRELLVLVGLTEVLGPEQSGPERSGL